MCGGQLAALSKAHVQAVLLNDPGLLRQSRWSRLKIFDSAAGLGCIALNSKELALVCGEVYTISLDISPAELGLRCHYDVL